MIQNSPKPNQNPPTQHKQPKSPTPPNKSQKQPETINKTTDNNHKPNQYHVAGHPAAEIKWEDVGRKIEDVEKLQGIRGVIIKSNEEVKKEVQRWSRINDTLQKKRQIQYELYKKKLEFEKEKEQKQQSEKKQAEQQAKRQKIKQRIQQISLRKNKRSQLFSNEKRSRVSEQKREPLYQEKQKQFQMKKLIEESRIKEEILKKKQQMMIDMDALKEHEEKFIQHLKERFKSKNKISNSTRKLLGLKMENQDNAESADNDGSPTLQKQLTQSKSSYCIYPNHDPVQKQKNQEKYLRRKKFEQKLKQFPIVVDKQKMKQALILKDKLTNPVKYNYLSNVAALSDQKIYEEFKDFEININRKEIGNDYMRQIHDKIPLSSRVKAKSEAQLKPIEKQPYKNYLLDVKHLLRKRSDSLELTNEVDEVMYRYNNNPDRIAHLNRLSDQYNTEVIKKIIQIRNASPTANYADYLGKEKAIDDLYTKSIKIKIATAKIA